MQNEPMQNEQQTTTSASPVAGNPKVCAVKDHVTCDLSGEAVILQLNDSVYYGLDPVGTSIWQLIQTPRTVTEVRDAIVEEYDVSPERCETDVRALLGEMAQSRLVTVQVSAC